MSKSKTEKTHDTIDALRAARDHIQLVGSPDDIQKAVLDLIHKAIRAEIKKL